MATLKDLERSIEEFADASSVDRKAVVRKLEPLVRSGELKLSDSEMESALSSDDELTRILAYLAVQYGRVPTSTVLLREMLTAEMELLRRETFDEDKSRMPLYYATRAYLERVKSDKPLEVAAVADTPMLRRIESELLIRDIDRKGQVLPKVQEAIEHLSSVRDQSANSTMASARLTLIGAIAAAIIAALSSIISAVITVRGSAKEPNGEERSAPAAGSASIPSATAPNKGMQAADSQRRN